jgi:pimeloyl-ACP methyl ester carboxylesterase
MSASHGNEPAGISVYDRLRRSDEQLLAWLAAGTHAHEVATSLGEAEYQLLAPLARQAANAPRDAHRLAVIVPGIMGSQLGRPRPAPWPPDLLWIDPVDVSGGRLLELGWPDTQGTEALGCIPYTYFALKLRLETAGYQTLVHSYDWRADVAATGAALAERLRALPASDIVIVAHSMGGLVARAALAHPSSRRVRRVVTLGTPHLGTLAAVQALRATYPTVRRLAALDPVHSAEVLAQRVFHSFPSLYDLLPVDGVLGELDLHDAANWPSSLPTLDPAALAAAGSPARRPPPADERCFAIVGTGQRTATRVRRQDDDFEYEISSDGDGTVPFVSARLPGGRTWYTASEHSNLPRSERVAHAAVEILRTGDTRLLGSEVVDSDEAHVHVTDTQLRATYAAKVDWRALSHAERAAYLNQLNLAPSLYAPR